jgi:RHS repeat-associated protein
MGCLKLTYTESESTLKVSANNFGVDEKDRGRWLDYGARMYDPTIGRWSASDPLSEIAFSLTPYRYCYNNPVNYTDPFGLWEQDANGNWSTNDVKDISRFLLYFEAETQGLNNNPSMDQVNGFIAGEESDGGAGLGRLSDGSALVSQVNVNGHVKNYSIGDYSFSHTYWVTDSKSVKNAWHEIQGDLSPDALDTRTLGNNIMGLSYPGGNNPRKYNGDYDYSYRPMSLSEYPAIGHDRRYDNLKAVGASGLFMDSRTIGADWKFVSEEFAIASMPIDLKTRVQAFILGVGLGIAATPKTLLKYATPQPSASGAEVMMWYSISNTGVTNKPQ